MRTNWSAPLARALTGRPLSAGVQPCYALLGAGNNTEMEGVFSRLKVENRSLIADAGSLADPTAVVQDRLEVYNRTRGHPSFGNRPPSVIVNDRYQEV